MRLLLLHPEVATRDCQVCEKYVYQDDGRQLLRFGLPVERPPGLRPPCERCPKIPKGSFPRPYNATRLSDRNRQAYTHYRGCVAVDLFPDDPIVKRNAGLIRLIEDEARSVADHLRHREMAGLLLLRGVPHGR